MSILQKILQNMYVEPDLLAELDDEQKQILFCKMREEQLRRYATYEKDLDEKNRQKQNASSSASSASSANENGSISSSTDGGSKRVRWLTGDDGSPWVWVMGEHRNDKTIDEILEEEIQDKARRLAEQEAEDYRRLHLVEEEELLKDKLRQEQMEADEERAKMEMQRRLDEQQRQAEEDEALKRRLLEARAKFNQPEQQLQNVEKSSSSINNSIGSKSSSRLAQEAYLKKELEQQRHWTDENEDLDKENRVVLRGAVDDPKEQDLVERRRSEIYQSLHEARERANREADKEAEDERRYWEDQERKARDAEDQIRSIARRAREQHKEHGLRTSTSLLGVLKTESQTQKKNHHVSRATPTTTAQQDGNDTIDGIINQNLDSNSGSGNSSPVVAANVTKLARPPKPQSREAIVEWYLREELPSGSGLEMGSSRFAPWFHGILSREEAEQLLKPPRPPGAFLVRVSARIWGYAISFNLDPAAGKVKHFLIEKVNEVANGDGGAAGGYQLYGTNQLVHASLWDLITYHQTIPITAKGGELLKEPVGQVRFPPDYQELLGFGSNASTATNESSSSSSAIARRQQRP